MIYALILSLLSFVSQPELVRLTLMNPSKEVIHLRIENFDDIAIAPDAASDLNMAVGDKIFGLEQIDTENWKAFEVLVVEADHDGKLINVQKLYKKALKDELSK